MKNSLKTLLAVAAFAASLSMAHAANDGNENGNGCVNNCGQGGGQGGNGGTGGTGGNGGNGGVGNGGAGGSANGGTHIQTTTNANTNLNTNAQQQGQIQGQQQGISNSGNSSATGGQGGSSSSSSTSSSGGNSLRVGDTANTNTTGASTSGSTADNNSANNIAITGDTYTAARIPVATAYAPAINPTAVCALSTSGGAQTPGFGFSLGGSYIDKNCELLEQVRAAHNIGQREVATEMMMDVPAFAAASKRLADRKNGKPVASVEPSTTLTLGSTASDKTKVEYTDPIIRKRLGLAPL